MSTTVVAILAIVAVAALAMLLRRGSGSDAATAPRPDPGAPEPARAEPEEDEDEIEEEEDEDAEELSEAPVPITSAGVAVVSAGQSVRLVTLHAPEDRADWLESSILAGVVMTARVQEALGVARRMCTGVETLHAGDFSGARIRRDAEGGWRLETLGREGEFGYMLFETESAARTAHEMFEHSEVVRRPLDEDGNPVPPSSEDFEEARRRFEETERELATATDDDEPAPPNEWSSRR